MLLSHLHPLTKWDDLPKLKPANRNSVPVYRSKEAARMRGKELRTQAECGVLGCSLSFYKYVSQIVDALKLFQHLFNIYNIDIFFFVHKNTRKPKHTKPQKETISTFPPKKNSQNAETSKDLQKSRCKRAKERKMLIIDSIHLGWSPKNKNTKKRSFETWWGFESTNFFMNFCLFEKKLDFPLVFKEMNKLFRDKLHF